MKNNGTLILLFLLFFTVITWIFLQSNQGADEEKFNEYMSEAIMFEKKEIYVDAVVMYNKALQIQPNNVDVLLKYAIANKQLGNNNEFIDACKRAGVVDPTNDIPFIMQAEHYISKNEFGKAIKLLQGADQIADQSKVKPMLAELKGKYVEKYSSFEEIYDWYGNYVPIKVKGQWGLAKADGSRSINYEYDYVGGFSDSEEVIPVKSDGEFYYIDINGNRKLVADDNFDDLGIFSDGVARARLDGKYGFINRKFNKFSFDFDYAGSMIKGVAPVQKGEKWALIDSEFKQITDYIYDDIIMDVYGFCSRYGVIFVKQNGKYRLVDLQGNAITDGIYDDAKIFVSNEPAAVMVGDQWGFIDKTGKEVITPQYEDANSFSIDLGGYYSRGKWGFINSANEIVIEPTFLEAKAFSRKGIAPVRTGNNWFLIQLYEYID